MKTLFKPKSPNYANKLYNVQSVIDKERRKLGEMQEKLDARINAVQTNCTIHEIANPGNARTLIMNWLKCHVNEVIQPTSKQLTVNVNKVIQSKNQFVFTTSYYWDRENIESTFNVVHAPTKRQLLIAFLKMTERNASFVKEFWLESVYGKYVADMSLVDFQRHILDNAITMKDDEVEAIVEMFTAQNGFALHHAELSETSNLFGEYKTFIAIQKVDFN